MISMHLAKYLLAVLILLAAVAVQIEGFMADGITSGPSGLVSHLDIPLENQPLAFSAGLTR